MRIFKLFFYNAFIISLGLFLIGCQETEMMPDDNGDRFERKPMLQHWADHLIIPAYDQYLTSLVNMQNSVDALIESPEPDHLMQLRTDWLTAYKHWQHVSMYEIGRAESLGLRNFTNIYPVDTTGINANIRTGEYNLNLPSNYDTQGFPALDYILFGIGDSDEKILELLADVSYQSYLENLTNRLIELTREVSENWSTDYRDIFVNNDASSGTASVDKMANDFMFYYEKFFRAGKIGIPAGVFSGNVLKHTVEAPYSGIYSKELFMEAFTAVQNFFNGISYIDGSNGLSLDDYIRELGTVQNRDLNAEINNHWTMVNQMLPSIDDNFYNQLESDPGKLLQLYDEIQKTVVLLKVDMMQLLNIQIDYVDADGD